MNIADSLPQTDQTSDTVKKTLLLVDDDKRFLDMLGKFLQREGIYNVVTCTDGNHLFDVAKKCNPDLILLDVLMPGRGGEELINDLRDDVLLSKVPVIFLTGLLGASECNDGIKKIGSCYFMAKSTNKDHLLVLIREKVFAA